MNFEKYMSATMAAQRVIATTAVAFLMALAAVALFGSLAAPHVAADEPDTTEEMTAGVIVQFDENASAIRSVEFSEPISGFAALVATGLEIEYQESEFGTAICSIEGVGCPADDCFCQCTGEGPCLFWSYQYWDGSDWNSYAVGAGDSVISQTGQIDGFHWSDGSGIMTPATRTVNAGRALLALDAAQAEDGGYGSQSSSVESLIAFGANAMASTAIQPAGGQSSLLGYAMLNSPAYTNPPSETAAIAPAAVGKLASGAVGSDTCWSTGTATPAALFDAEIGAYSVHAGINAWGILGALAYDGTVPDSAVEQLKGAIQSDGGWEWMEGFGSDTNSTALAIQAMVGAGTEISATEVISGLIFLQSAQSDDGGFAYAPAAEGDAASDANSTAYVIQALYAAGEDPTDPTWTRGDNATPLSYLQSLQLADGTFEWQAGSGSSILATQQAVPALLGHAFPIAGGIEACDTVWLPFLSSPN